MMMSPLVSGGAFAGLRVTIVGAAREGTALARFLARCGAQVTLSDNKSREQVAQHLGDLADGTVRLALGPEQPGDLLAVDVLFLSPGVPPNAAIVQRARALGLPISSEPRLFTQLCPAPIVGITGSSGKSTTTALLGAMFRAAGRTTWVGGNIGQPLIERLLSDERPQAVVMELSSFQLELFAPDYQGPSVADSRSAKSQVVSLDGWSPHVACITNITPNHLDRHRDMADYRRCKAHILAFQRPTDWAVLNQDDEASRDIARRTEQVLRFSLQGAVASGAFLRGDELVLRHDDERVLCLRSDLLLRGRHNVANVLAAACCGLASGLPLEAMSQAAVAFAGVPHRLETVRRRRDVLWVNDSIATSPERAIAALGAYSEPIVLLAGGRDKHLPWERWADVVLHKARLVIAFGELRPIAERALADARQRAGLAADVSPLHLCDTLEDAVALAEGLSRSGDVVLLSPGGTSFDAFDDFEARGERFSEIVRAL